ncbi:MAG: hypothetical protein SFU99_12245 [Saprospiraceae bacterium]|nr:hypothetical protein [Saprospiraceae bacterium]
MKSNYPKNYDVIVAFIVFLICILCALFVNLSHLSSTVAGVN